MTFSRTQSPRSAARRGVAILWVLIILIVLSMLLAAISWEHVFSRRVLDARHKKLQADWLARAGVEDAVARLLEKPGELKEESIDLAPDARVRIRIQPDPKSKDVFVVTSETSYPTGDKQAAAKKLVRKFRRVEEKSKTRVEPVAAEAAK